MLQRSKVLKPYKGNITNALCTSWRGTACTSICNKNLGISCLNSAALSLPPSPSFHSSFRGSLYHHHHTTVKLFPGLFSWLEQSPLTAGHNAPAGNSFPFSTQAYHDVLDRDNGAWVDCIRHHFNDDRINILRKSVQKILRRKQSAESYGPEITPARSFIASLRHLHSPSWALGLDVKASHKTSDFK